MQQFNYTQQQEADHSLNVGHISNLENQIQTMLNGVMADEVDNSNTSLHFSEDEDYPKVDLPVQTNPKIKRTSKKCSTISPNQYYNPYQNKMITSTTNRNNPSSFLKAAFINTNNQFGFQPQQDQQPPMNIEINMFHQMNNIYMQTNNNSPPARSPIINGNPNMNSFTGYSNQNVFLIQNQNQNIPITNPNQIPHQTHMFYNKGNASQTLQGIQTTPQNINNFKRNDLRRKTYEVNANNMQIMQMQQNYFNFQNNLAKNNIINKVNISPPQRQQQVNNNNHTTINLQQIPQQDNNTNQNISKSFMQKQQQTQNIRGRKEKRFNTITLQQGVNMQVELLLYEINNELVKNEKIDFFIYNKLKNNFTNVIKTHKGSRIFQNYLKKTPSDIIQLIYQEIKPSLIDIMCDFYGNYFIKKFFGCLNKKERLDFISVIKPCFSKLSFDSVGTFPIQGIIEQLNCPYEKHLIISLIQPNLNAFAFNAYGSHVVEKITMCFESEYTQFIFEYGIDNFELLAMDQSGICVIKNILLCKDNPKYFSALKKLVLDNLKNLVNHQYGNQVIQAAVQTWSMEDITEIVNLLKNNFALFSMGKYSSNVVEKCIEKNEEILNMFINEICTRDQIGQVMKNSFGNYVIQKALKIAKGNNELLLADFVNRNIYKLNDKKLIIKWKGIVTPHLGTNSCVSSNIDNELIQCIEEDEGDDYHEGDDEDEDEDVIIKF